MASSYVSANGSTRLLLDEKNWYGEYQTQINGKVWAGEITPGRILGHTGNRAMYSSFKDNPGVVLESPDEVNSFCSGGFTAIQTVENGRYVLKARWSASEGKNCPGVGQPITLRLVEALPIADKKGDYFFENSKEWYGLPNGQNEFHTWDLWQVVDASGPLSCRVKPNGKIMKTYRRGDRITAGYDGRGHASAILGADNKETHPSALNPSSIKGAPWMRTSDKCFVRANRQYIQPLSGSKI
ncbi:hypothetical protein NDA01_31450 [Trichocoleus desertorum AS-A10]|uniref:hypothetical protein n=1 Tax=Trichocoleus desertorum TaxID=1481672 RepID=UPI003296E4FF